MADNRDWRNEPVSALALSIRAQNCVRSTRVATIGELCDLTEDEFLALRGFGETSLRETSARLAELGLRFRTPSEPRQYRVWYPGRASPSEVVEKAHWSLAQLGVSGCTCNALEAAGLTQLHQLVSRSSAELLELPGVDDHVVRDVVSCLAAQGFRLGMPIPSDGSGT